jgi:hypothetical protein
MDADILVSIAALALFVIGHLYGTYAKRKHDNE